MENWLGLFLLIIFGALFNLIIAFGILRGLANLAGVPADINTPRRALLSLLTIVPVAGVAGAPFFILPFIGPIFGTFVSACVAPMMFAEKYALTQGMAARIILPTVLTVYIVSGLILYCGIPLL